MKHIAEQFTLPGIPAPAEPDHSARKHARFSPSKLNYLDPAVGGCPGFHQDSSTSAAAEEGTEHHELLDKLIGEWWALGEHRGTLDGYLFARRVALKWSDEADYLYRFCAEVVEKYLARATEVHRERTVHVVSLRDRAPVTWGHFDLLVVINDVGILVDWKFGSVAVEPADTNRQGFAYAAGALQKWFGLQKLGVIFAMPRLRWVTKAMFTRRDLETLVGTVEGIVRAAERMAVRFDRDAASIRPDELNPGSACTYCTRAAECPGFLSKLQVAAPKFGGLPAPQDFNLDAIDTPQKAAVAHAWAHFLEEKLGSVKKKCLEIAKLNGGSLSAVDQEGNEIVFKVYRRGVDRTLGQAPLVADCLSPWVAPEQILAAADLALGRLEDIVVPAMQDQDESLSKKDAKERLASHLEAHGLLSRPDGSIEYLRKVKSKKEVSQ